ncbi:MAG: isocitrate lyase/PEP mutase family protein [Gammaproteobacteria bacterium]|nr:isocitrate lyase/PEP mutase family protein [Gammaproteobacteria bacterium]
MSHSQTTSLRQALEARRALLVPGVANALAARVVEDLGFQACYLSGAGVTNTFLGLPDLAFISLSELAAHVGAIRDATTVPLIVDADTGFGNAVNVYQAVRRLERAGANALQIEDQVSPKKCGHFGGKQVISCDEMTGKIKAALDARDSDDLLLIARTDARSVEGFEAAIERARRYIEAGADVTFVEAPENIEEIRRIPALLSAPQLLNMVVGGNTPIMPQHDLAELGFGLVLYANVALQAALLGMQRALGALQAHGSIDEHSGLVASFAERQRSVKKSRFDDLADRYASD